jgi:hypothetical protein
MAPMPPAQVHHAAAGQVERRGAVERVDRGAGGLRGDQQLAVDVKAQLGGGVLEMRGHRAQGVGQQARVGTAQQVGQEPLPAACDEIKTVMQALRRPGRRAQRQIPERVGGALLPAEELCAGRAKDTGMFVPAPLVAVAGDAGAAGQVHGHARFAGVRRPRVDAGGLRHHIHRPAGIEAASQRGARVEAVLLVVEGAGAAAGVDVGFEHRHIQPGLGEEGGGGQATHPGADHHHTILSRHKSVFQDLRRLSLSQPA